MEVLELGAGRGRLEVKNEGKRARLNIYGYIVSDEWEKLESSDVVPEEIQEFLSVIGDMDVDVHINSGGGTIYSGMAIYNMLKRHKGHKTVYIDGVAGSIASVIAMAGDKIICPVNSYFMIHKAWIAYTGNSNEFKAKVELLETMDEGILNVYKEKLKDGIDIEIIKEMMEKETWMTGAEAAKYFDIEVSDAVQIAACIDKEYCDKHNVPGELRAIKEEALNKSILEAKAKVEIEKEKTKLMIN